VEEYRGNGAEIVEDISESDVVLGVKEVPPHQLVPGKTMVFFAHVIKAQPSGMPLLDALLSQGVRLIDYEAITAGGVRGGQRLVAFGRFAGIVGAIDILRGVGERALALGFSTPFLGIAAAWQYPTLETAFQAVQKCGLLIKENGLPESLCPFSIAITGLSGDGGGRVALGAREVLEALGVVWIPPRKLVEAISNLAGKKLTHAVIGVGLDIEDVVVRSPSGSAGIEGNPEEREASEAVTWASSSSMRFERAHYKADPTQYLPAFHYRTAPYISVLLHCSYWEPRFPRLLTRAQVKTLSMKGSLRLLAVGDVSCDVGGAIEWSTPTSIQSPFLVYEPLSESCVWDISAAPGVGQCVIGHEHKPGNPLSPVGRGILMHAVDHLPSEVPRDATTHFGACLLPHLPALAANSRWLAEGGHKEGGFPCNETRAPACLLPAELEGAVICSQGALTTTWQFISSLREASERALALRMSSTGGENGSTSTIDALASSSSAHQADEGKSPLLSPPSSPRGVGICCSVATFLLRGHVFDSGILSRFLDFVEDFKSVSVAILDCRVGKNRESPTELVLQLAAACEDGSAGKVEEEAAAGSSSALLISLHSLASFAAQAGLTLALQRGGHMRPRGVSEVALAGVLEKYESLGSGGRGGDAVSCSKIRQVLPPSLTPQVHSPSSLKTPRTSPPPSVLVLGSGYVSTPCVELLRKRFGFSVTLGSAVFSESSAIAARFSHVTALHVEVTEEGEGMLSTLISRHAAVISLVPAHLHPIVARAAIASRRHMVTASYTSPALEKLHKEAVSAGITILNECGLDPGACRMQRILILLYRRLLYSCCCYPQPPL